LGSVRKSAERGQQDPPSAHASLLVSTGFNAAGKHRHVSSSTCNLRPLMTPAIDLLKKARAEHRVHSYPHDPKAPSYGLEAAEKLGLPAEQVFKTLLAASEKGELLVAVVPVAGSLDLKALAQAAGVKKAEMADPAAAQRATGYLLGGISPLGQKKRLRTFIDESARRQPSIYVSAGRRGLEVELAAEVLATHTQASFAAIGR
jgi:Cys-tRNA(Pro)/Cys-tRNA(Cys) deacylase